jgi:hypothetical protein
MPALSTLVDRAEHAGSCGHAHIVQARDYLTIARLRTSDQVVCVALERAVAHMDAAHVWTDGWPTALRELYVAARRGEPLECEVPSGAQLRLIDEEAA